MKTLVLLLMLAIPATKQPSAASKIKWQRQVIQATGLGAPDLRANNLTQARVGAEKAARADAARLLVEKAKSIRINADKTIGEAMTSPDVRRKIEDVAREFKITSKRYFSDGGLEIDVELPLATLNEIIAESADKCPALKMDDERKISGLVIDARGLDVVFALAPRLLDESGKLIYGFDCLSAEAREISTVVTYVQSLEEAKKNTLVVGEKPLIVKAAKVHGSDILLSKDDLKKLPGNVGFFAEGRVVVVAK